jgi:hypothetical protein
MYENLQKNITDTKTELHGDSYNEDTGFLSNGNNFHYILITYLCEYFLNIT